MRLAVDISIDGDINPDVLDRVAREAAEVIMEHVHGAEWSTDRVGRLPAPRWIGDEQ